MLRFLGKTTELAARSGGSGITTVCVSNDEGLSAWELVNAAQSDDEDLYSYDSEEAASTADEASGDDLEPEAEEEEVEDDDVDVDEDAPAPRDFVSPSVIIAVQAMSVSPPITFPVEMARDFVGHDLTQEYHDEDDDLNDEDDVGDDYDDDLVPWKLKGRFGKRRITKTGIRKMGQIGGPKLQAKKLPYYYNRPGVSHGKLR